MNEALTEFIDKRVNCNYYRLRQDKQWKKTNEEFKASYEKLRNELQGEQKEELDNIIDLKNILMGMECDFGYRIGASDTFKLFKMFFII